MNLESQLKSLNERKTRLSADLCRVIAENEGVEEELKAFHRFIKQLRFRDQIAVQDQPLVCKNLNLYEETLVNIGTSLFKSYPPKRIVFLILRNSKLNPIALVIGSEVVHSLPLK